MDEQFEEFGKKIKELRANLGLTQADLALLAGCGTTFISQLERGKPTARLDKVTAVLNALGQKLSMEPLRESGS